MAEPWLICFFACNREMQGISGRVRALNLTVPLGSGRVGSDNLGYGPGSGFSFEPVQTSNSHTEYWEEKRTARSLSVSPSVTQVHGFFPLTFRVSSASGLFFTLVCSTYLLTSRVLVNVGFVQTWCLVECDSRLCLSEIFFSFLNLLNQESVWHFLAVFH